MNAIHSIAENVRLAAFDVDETILSFKGLFSFAEYFFCSRSGADGRVDSQPYASWREALRRCGTLMPREQVNRVFYRAFAGYDEDLLQSCAWDWFDRLLSEGAAILIEPALAAIQEYRANDTPVVLLSGSARLFLGPLATLLDATYMLAIELEVDAFGRLTGELLPPQTIGEGKWQALCALLEDLGLSAGECAGYGDHLSDLPFLGRVGQPVIVAGDAALESIAVTRGWPILPRIATTPPLSWLARRGAQLPFN